MHRFYLALPPFSFPGRAAPRACSPAARIACAQQTRFSGKGGVASLEAENASRKGDVTTAEGDVGHFIRGTTVFARPVGGGGWKNYNSRLRAHGYRPRSARFYGNRAPQADEAHYNVSTGHGLFHNVRRANIKDERRPNPTILISENPLYCEARTSNAFPGEVLLIHRAWITICDPRPEVAVLRF